MVSGFVPTFGNNAVASRSRTVTCSRQGESDAGISRRNALQAMGYTVAAGLMGMNVGMESAEALSLKRLKMGPRIEGRDGVSYREIKVGEGYEPSKGDTVTIHFSLFCDGIEVETSRDSQGLAARPLGFTWGTERGPGSIIKGVPIGMEGMKVGGQRMITVPPELAFGKRGQPPLIPGDSTVDFAISLLSVKRAGSNPNVSSKKSAVF